MTDADIALVLCHDTDVTLSQTKRASKHNDDHQHVRKRIGTLYIELEKLLHIRGHQSEALTSYKKAEKFGLVGPFCFNNRLVQFCYTLVKRY